MTGGPDLGDATSAMAALKPAYNALPTPPSGVVNGVLKILDDLESDVVSSVDEAIAQIDDVLGESADER